MNQARALTIARSVRRCRLGFFAGFYWQPGERQELMELVRTKGMKDIRTAVQYHIMKGGKP